MKRCKHCGDEKPLDDFYGDTAARDGHRPECTACTAAGRKRWYAENREREIARVKEWQQANAERLNAYRRVHNATPERRRKQRDTYYRRTFGISADDVDAMLEAQGGGCAICGERPARLASVHVDHCHDTGRIRGLLCLNCNQGIGKLGEDPERLRRAAEYLAATR